MGALTHPHNPTPQIVRTGSRRTDTHKSTGDIDGRLVRQATPSSLPQCRTSPPGRRPWGGAGEGGAAPDLAAKAPAEAVTQEAEATAEATTQGGAEATAEAAAHKANQPAEASAQTEAEAPVTAAQTKAPAAAATRKPWWNLFRICYISAVAVSCTVEDPSLAFASSMNSHPLRAVTTPHTWRRAPARPWRRRLKSDAGARVDHLIACYARRRRRKSGAAEFAAKSVAEGAELNGKRPLVGDFAQTPAKKTKAIAPTAPSAPAAPTAPAAPAAPVQPSALSALCTSSGANAFAGHLLAHGWALLQLSPHEEETVRAAGSLADQTFGAHRAQEQLASAAAAEHAESATGDAEDGYCLQLPASGGLKRVLTSREGVPSRSQLDDALGPLVDSAALLALSAVERSRRGGAPRRLTGLLCPSGGAAASHPSLLSAFEYEGGAGAEEHVDRGLLTLICGQVHAPDRSTAAPAPSPPGQRWAARAARHRTEALGLSPRPPSLWGERLTPAAPPLGRRRRGSRCTTSSRGAGSPCLGASATPRSSSSPARPWRAQWAARRRR